MRFLPVKHSCQSFCISTCLDYDHLEHYGANAQNTYRRIHKSYCSRPILTKRCYWAVILERPESRTLESHESIECFVVRLVCQVCQCLSWKRTLFVKKQNLKSETKLHILYAIYWTTLLPWAEEQNSNGCKLLVKKDAMLDSLDARERSYDNSANRSNFTIRKVNLMFVFILVVWIFSFNKYMIQNPVLFVYNVIKLGIVYAIVLSQAAQDHVSRKFMNASRVVWLGVKLREEPLKML